MIARLSGKRGLVVLLILLLVAFCVVMLRPVSLGGPATYVIIDGISMEPTYLDGDLVIIRRAGAYANGDVIAYYPSTAATDRASLTIHRIIGQTEQGDYTTQGDNRPEPDQWVARPGNVLGKGWLHVPHAGKAALWVREPQNLGFVIVGFVGLSLFGSNSGNQRSGRGTGMRNRARTKRRVGLQLPVPGWTIAALSVLGVVALLLTTIAFVSYRHPTENERVETVPKYEHTAGFDYSIQMERSTLYPEGVIGPVAPLMVNGQFQDLNAEPVPDETGEQADESGAYGGPPIFRQLAQRVDLGFSYLLTSDLPADVGGTYSAALEIVAGEDGWTMRDELLPPTAFEGTDLSFRVPINFVTISRQIEAIEEETGFAPSNYTISVIPSVELQGNVGAETINDTYGPAFTLDLDSTQITPPGEIVHNEARSDELTVIAQNSMSFGGLTTTISQARQVSTYGLMIVVAGAVAIAGVTYARLQRNEDSLIQVRYRPMLVSVAEADLDGDNLERVRLASMQDLARLAQRDGQIIFQQETGADGQRYFVQHGTIVYEYSTGQPELTTATFSKN